ncbi:phosphoenolpyruvate carboxykinase (GTP) [Thermogladius sp. 4427co]|uniref:phosphoenolpyruvate carboxykinase (GTP) n=1 Tax=Thermogladius sp. 4427co TaxID=3450718 RepID=UPI003F7B0817
MPDHNMYEILRKYMDSDHYQRLTRIPDQRLLKWVAEVAETAEPERIYVNTGSPEDFDFIRKYALENKEEYPTRYPRKTVHFDGIIDIARDRENTRILVPAGVSIPMINTFDRDRGLAEIRELFKGVMKGRLMFIGFYCFGPRGSPFSLYGVQVTDSAYVVHSENILYRVCYDVFVEKGDSLRYMRFLHATGERNELGWSKNVGKRRIYIDLEDNIVYSVNTQYAGNTVGLKKLSLRLCVNQGRKEGFLCEHMFIVGVRGPGGRVTYVTGAFPAGCGKTSTAMIADTLVSDDLAIIHPYNGEARAINPEIGSFGIIDGVNPVDDPEIYRVLLDPETEVIFSNILLTEDGEPWWRGRPEEPKKGLNYAGEWWPGKKDENNRDIAPSHPNGRFTTYLSYLKNLDPRIDDPMGVTVEAMIFGGRDSDTNVPVEEAFDWVHGNVTKAAALESERTAAVLGQAGVKELNPYAILDFLSVSPGEFLRLHLDFASRLKKVPKIFSVNYFLRDEHGRYLNEKTDKIVWLKWIELRVHGDVDALEAPTGFIPLYNDLAKLFGEFLNKDYTERDYAEQFKIRVVKQIERIDRVVKIYREDFYTPQVFYEVMREQRKRLEEARARYGDYIDPFKLDRR